MAIPLTFSWQKPALAARAFKFVFAGALIAAAFAATYTSSADAFSGADFREILLYGGAVNAILLLATLLIPPRVVANAVLALIVLAGVATAYIIHTDLFLGQNLVIIVLAPAAYILFVAFKVIDDLRWGGAALSAAALLGIMAIAAGHWTSGGLGASNVPVTGDVSNIRHVTFQETPNLYFVSFDALASRPLLNKYLDIETTEFHNMFEANFRRFPNFFANAVPTSHSFNTLLALDPDVYASQRAALEARGDDPNPFLFSGQNPSPLLDILHENGYETTSTVIDTYFGRRKGPYIHNYDTLEKYTVCNLLDDGIRNWAFWGYCRVLPVGNTGDNRLTAERVTNVKVGGGPQFVIAYLYVPHHVSTKSFLYSNAEQLEKYRAKHLTNSEKAARYLELIIRHLDENDPTAILFVFGDHGPFLSRELDFEENREFIIQDHYGVLGGVYPPDTCPAWFDEAYTQGYLTILDAVHALLRCLSGGESVLIEPRQYVPSYGYGTIPQDVKLDYKEFLYE